MDDLIKWKHNEDRKPMVLKGARQIGKTWLMKEFGRQQYKNFVYFNFDEEDALKSIFESNKNPQRILRFSRRGYVTNGGITNLPLYLAPKTRELL